MFSCSRRGQNLRWYEELVGFVGHRFPENELHAFGIIERDHIEIMLQRLDGYQKLDLYSNELERIDQR